MTAAPETNIGTIIDSMHAIREQKRELNAQIKYLDASYEELKTKLLEKMDSEGMLQSKSNLATATITTTVVPQVEDWDAVFDYVKQNDAFYLLQKRINSGPYRELLQMDEQLPGTKPFTKVDISLKTTS